MYEWRRISYYTVFVVTHVVYLSVNFSTCYLWIKRLGNSFYRDYAFEVILYYSKFFYNLLIYIILTMLMSRYKYVTYMLSEKFSLSMMTKLKRNIYLLKETVEVFNDLMGYPLLLLILYASLRILFYFETIIREASSSKIEMLISDFALILIFLVGATGVILISNSIITESEEILAVCYRHKDYNDDVRRFIDAVKDNSPKLSAARFFYIDKSTIFSIANSVTTFLIVMIQFKAIIKDIGIIDSSLNVTTKD